MLHFFLKKYTFRIYYKLRIVEFSADIDSHLIKSICFSLLEDKDIRCVSVKRGSKFVFYLDRYNKDFFVF